MTFNISLTPIQFGYANGDRFAVYPAITNPTDSPATDTVTLSVDGDEQYSHTVTLPPIRTERIRLAWTVDVSENAVLPVTVSTSSDSDSDDVTFRIHDDVIRVRADEEVRNSDSIQKRGYVENTEKVGPDTL